MGAFAVSHSHHAPFPSSPRIEKPGATGIVERIAAATQRALDDVGATLTHWSACILAKISVISYDKEQETTRKNKSCCTLSHLAMKVHSAAKHSFNAMRSGFRRVKGMSKGVIVFKAIGFLSIPMDLADAISDLRIALKTKDPDLRYISGVSAMASAADVADGSFGLFAFIHALWGFGPAFVTALQNCVPLLSVLSTVGLVAAGYAYGDAKHLEGQIKLDLEKGVSKAIDTLLTHHKRCLQRKFSVDYDVKEDLRKASAAIANNVPGAQREAARLVGALKGRLGVKLTSYKVKITANIVAMIGASILLMVPAWPVGSLILLASGLIALGNMIYEWRELYHDPKPFVIRPPLEPFGEAEATLL